MALKYQSYSHMMGFKAKNIGMKPYCQTLTLVDDEEMIARYVEAHAHVWPEVIEGQRTVGILDGDRDMDRLATLRRQAEWEAYVSQFQGCSPDARSDEKWQMMERIF